MSDMEIDYLPFDYVTYMQQILPALHRVLEGDEVPLVTLLQPLSHISFGPRSLLRLPLSPENTNWLLEGRPFHRAMSLEGLLDASTLSRVRAGEPLDPWQALAKVIPFLKGRSLNSLGRYGEMLHFHLFYTLCTGPSTLSEMYKSSLLPHDEHIFRWREYTDRDEEMRALWGTFYQAHQKRSHNIPRHRKTRVGFGSHNGAEKALSDFSHRKRHNISLNMCVRRKNPNSPSIPMITCMREQDRDGQLIESCQSATPNHCGRC